MSRLWRNLCAALAVGSLVVGAVACSHLVPVDVPQPDEPLATDTPVAEVPPNKHPAPAKKRLSSELIVGTWMRDNKRSDGKLVEHVWDEFTADGKHVRRSEGSDVTVFSEGRYKLDGDALSFQSAPDKPRLLRNTDPLNDEDIEEWSFTVDFVTENQLIVHSTRTLRLAPVRIDERARAGEDRVVLAAQRTVERAKAVYDRAKPAPLVGLADGTRTAPTMKVEAQGKTAPAKLKPWSELIVGTWMLDKKRSDSGLAGTHWLEFTADGNRIRRNEFRDETRIGEGRYKLDGNAISYFHSPDKPPLPPRQVDPSADIVEVSETIDFATENELIIHITETTRLSPQMIEEQAKGGYEERRAAAAAVRNVERTKMTY